ncbi:Mov34/MPN/PAD-1 family protein [Pseudomonas alloputida]|uniref:Mov34/MPN/PAD-1 family protein n=1 Tax=Pseudomonas alloputida TaxID=1940621 RepID=UPI001E2F343C|nr:Mov34/MPN/PAD-1 family protein [Pseudomonas alloputida]
MRRSSLLFQIRGASWCLEFPIEIVEQLEIYAKKGGQAHELVGQLYTRDPSASFVRVDCITEVAPNWAKRAGVRLDMKTVRRERERFFAEGYHCLGFWHSHPEPRPHISQTDLVMAEEQARAGKSEYQGLVFIIIGTSPAPVGFGVWVHDGESLWRAELLEQSTI